MYNSLFSLFHHDCIFQDNSFSFDTKELHQKAIRPTKYSVQDIADALYKIVIDSVSNCTDSQISLTLTGGYGQPGYSGLFTQGWDKAKLSYLRSSKGKRYFFCQKSC